MKELIENLLFASPEPGVYAIVDGASMDELLDYLEATRPEHECLYRGDLKPGMAEVAPFLVRLEPGSAFLKWLLADGWGNHFGVFVLSDEELLPLKLHLRRHLRVHTESGEAKLFRYYDPRVLRRFLPTLTPQEATDFFGPVRRFLCEIPGGEAIESFHREDQAVVRRSFSKSNQEWTRT